MSCVGFEALTQLRHLRKFIFGEYFDDWTLERKFLHLCGQHLPQLQIMGRDFVNGVDLLMYEHVFEEESYHDQVVAQPCKLGLEQLALSDDNLPHEHCLLPGLKALHLIRADGDVIGSFFDRFTTITELAFYSTEKDLVMEVLECVGRRLTHLGLSNMEEELSMSTILQHCPNLVKLKMEYIQFDEYHAIWPNDVTLSCLQEVELDMQFEPLPLPHDFIAKVLGYNEFYKILFLKCASREKS